MSESEAQQDTDLSSRLWIQTPTDTQMRTNRQEREPAQTAADAHTHAHSAPWWNEACGDTLWRERARQQDRENHRECETEQMMCRREVNNASSCDRLRHTFHLIDFESFFTSNEK